MVNTVIKIVFKTQSWICQFKYGGKKQQFKSLWLRENRTFYSLGTFTVCKNHQTISKEYSIPADLPSLVKNKVQGKWKDIFGIIFQRFAPLYNNWLSFSSLINYFFFIPHPYSSSFYFMFVRRYVNCCPYSKVRAHATTNKW